ncbi:MAG: hypothetical protein LQ338_005841 [Usnochroma carphineum]|nr:MAG: hypothetical protein LQ338_005841 [Usnochroma carphineum]
MSLSNNVLILLATLISFAISHPLNLLHSHHRHHTHHHTHLRLPFSSHAAKSVPRLQHPISDQSTPVHDISNVFVNMTVKSSESSAPSSFLIPLRRSSPQVELTSSIFHHPRTARVSNIQYGTASEESSRQFEHAEDVACYAHTQPTSSQLRRRDTQGKQPQPTKLAPFGQSDGEINFAEAGGEWFVGDGQVSGFECVLKS